MAEAKEWGSVVGIWGLVIEGWESVIEAENRRQLCQPSLIPDP